jgi:hypothetical protein
LDGLFANLPAKLLNIRKTHVQRAKGKINLRKRDIAKLTADEATRDRLIKLPDRK